MNLVSLGLHFPPGPAGRTYGGTSALERRRRSAVRRIWAQSGRERERRWTFACHHLLLTFEAVRFGPLAFATCRSALKPFDQPKQVGRRRIVQNVGVDPHEVPRSGELQDTLHTLLLAIRP